MALIKCPECGKDVSDRASNCIHCGFPLVAPKSELIIRGKTVPDAISKHIYFLYDNDSFFDEVMPGEVKHYPVNKPMRLVLGHKRGSLAGSGIKDSVPVTVEPGKITRLEASIRRQLFSNDFLLSEIDIIDSE